MRDLWLPRTVLEADFLVSMPKIKTHHRSGVTLSMKNMFGVVPGTRYGWPKNILHWKGIQESILDLCATVPIRFVIRRRSAAQRHREQQLHDLGAVRQHERNSLRARHADSREHARELVHGTGQLAM